MNSTKSLSVVVLALLVLPSFAALNKDLEEPIDTILLQAGRAGEEFDAGPLLRLEALLREAKSPADLRALENRLLKWLRPDAPPRAREYACRLLWRIGSPQSVPVLRKLLADPETVDLACYAIAQNRCPEFGQALREVLPGSTGKAAIGIINLLGQRRDSLAVETIRTFLTNRRPEVRAAALEALGKIGGPAAVKVLANNRNRVPPEQRLIAGPAYLRATENLDLASAVPIWKTLMADVKETLGVRKMALLRLSAASPAEALPWILAALGEAQPRLRPVTGPALRHLRGHPAAAQVGAALGRLPPAGQVIVIEALGDNLSVEALTPATRSTETTARRAAWRALSSRGNVPAVSQLLADALAPGKTEDRSFLLQLLSEVPGRDATTLLLQALPSVSPENLGDLIKVLHTRGASVPLSVVVERVRHSDGPGRLKVIPALSLVAAPGDLATLFGLLKAETVEAIHQQLEQVLARTLRRSEDREPPARWLAAELKTGGRPADRQTCLRLLSGLGTTGALEAVLGALRSADPAEQRVAFQSLCSWPNEKALGPLLRLAAESPQAERRILAYRAAVRLLNEAKLPAGDKIKLFRQLQPLTGDSAARKLWLSGLAAVPHPGALEMILSSTDDSATRPEAVQAALAVARRLPLAHAEALSAAMRKVAAVADETGGGEARWLIVPPRPQVYLDSLTPVALRSGNASGKPMVNRNCTGGPLRIQGTTFARGLGEHARAELSYALRPEFHRFVALIGLDDQVGRFNDIRGSSLVKIFCDGKPILETPLLRGAGAWCGVDLEIPRGARVLRLVIEDGGDGVDFDDVNLVNAGFVTKLAFLPTHGPSSCPDRAFAHSAAAASAPWGSFP